MTAKSLEIRFESNEVVLAGTVLMPDAPTGGVLILSGSGPLDLNSNMRGLHLDVANTFARALAESGWASLRFDKRGVGASTGDALTGGFEDETADAAAAMKSLRTAVDGPLVVLGHSIGGGTIAIRVAARHTVAGVVLLATPAQRVSVVVDRQTEHIAATLPGPSWLVPPIFKAAQRRGRRRLDQSTGDTFRRLIRPQPARWYREAFEYDPGSDLAALTCPVLAVAGGKDLQVYPSDVVAIGQAVKGPFRGETPPDLTHLLRSETGKAGIMSYGRQLARPVDPTLVDDVVAWIVAL